VFPDSKLCILVLIRTGGARSSFLSSFASPMLLEDESADWSSGEAAFRPRVDLEGLKELVLPISCRGCITAAATDGLGL